MQAAKDGKTARRKALAILMVVALTAAGVAALSACAGFGGRQVPHGYYADVKDKNVGYWFYTKEKEGADQLIYATQGARSGGSLQDWTITSDGTIKRQVVQRTLKYDAKANSITDSDGNSYRYDAEITTKGR